jgi:hypothetical protein
MIMHNEVIRLNYEMIRQSQLEIVDDDHDVVHGDDDLMRLCIVYDFSAGYWRTQLKSQSM